MTSRVALGTIPLPLILDDPYTREKPQHFIEKEDCALFEPFLVQVESHETNGGTGDSFCAGPLRIEATVTTKTQHTESKLVVNKEVLRTQLKQCGDSLKVLGLNFCYSIDEEVVEIITEHCNKLEFLDLSFSTNDEIPFEIWNSLAAKIGNTLFHLNITCFTGIDDNGLSVIFEHCQKLEAVEVSVAPFRDLKGTALSKTPKSVKKMFLFIEGEKDSDKFAETVLSSLCTSAAKESITHLRIRKQLTNEAMDVVSKNMKHLKCLDIVESSSLCLDYTKLAYSIAAFTELEELLIQLPEEQQFNTELSNILHHCPKLIRLSIFGGLIEDETLELLNILVPNIELLCFSHLSYEICRHFEQEFTNVALEVFAKLKNLKHLKINDAFVSDRAAIKFLENFEGDLNKLQTLDLRNCRKISVKTLNVCLAKSKLREDTDCVPLKVFCDDAYKMETVDSTPATVEFSYKTWVNACGFWNEYFTPWFNYNAIDDKTENFIESQLKRIGEKFFQKGYSRLRSFYLKTK